MATFPVRNTFLFRSSSFYCFIVFSYSSKSLQESYSALSHSPTLQVPLVIKDPRIFRQSQREKLRVNRTNRRRVDRSLQRNDRRRRFLSPGIHSIPVADRHCRKKIRRRQIRESGEHSFFFLGISCCLL
jgi:hypothetical protein